nr:hypothetical protein [Tanacetum cinerariifolium]
MRTRRSCFPPTSTIPRRSRKQTTNVVEPEFCTMAQMLQAPNEGYEDAIVVPQINANNFELKQTLINLVQSNQFTGEARIWLDKEPLRSIMMWEDLVSKFINEFLPPSKTTYLRNEITNFLQKPSERFNEAWERFKALLRQCPHHVFSELHQLDTFYNALNPNDQDALDFAAGGNFQDKILRECLSIIESKSKVRYSMSRVIDVRANLNAPLSSSSPSNAFELQQIAASLEDKLDIRMNRFEKSLNDMKNYFVTPTAPLKAVEEACVTYGANHSYNHCPLTRGNNFPVFHDNIQQFQAAAVGNFIQNHYLSSQRNTNFLQKSNETFNEAWERFKDLLRQCPHRGFSELHQLDTFYNALTPNDQDALDSAAGGNFLDKIPRECLSIIESKSKIAASLEDKLEICMNQFEKSLKEMKNSFITPTAPLKAVAK